MDKINVYDFGVQYGFSVFETFLVSEKGNIFMLSEHIERVYNSIKVFNIPFKMEKAELKNKIYNFIAKNHIHGKVLRLTITSGNLNLNIEPKIIFTYRENKYSKEKLLSGAKILISETKKNETSILSYHKTSNYLENYISLENALNLGFNDVLFLNTSSYLAETSKANIFVIKENRLLTPSLECGILNGIIRMYLKQNSYKFGLNFIEDKLDISVFENAEEVFISNSVHGIMPVTQVSNTNFNKDKIGIFTAELFKNVYDLINNY